MPNQEDLVEEVFNNLLGVPEGSDLSVYNLIITSFFNKYKNLNVNEDPICPGKILKRIVDRSRHHAKINNYIGKYETFLFFLNNGMEEYDDMILVYCNVKNVDARIIKELIDAGCDINYTIKNTMFTPINAACGRNNTHLIQILLDHGAITRSNDIEVYCNRGKDLNILTLLLEKVSAAELDLSAYLLEACAAHNLLIAKFLIEEYNLPFSHQAVRLCVANYDSPIVQFLIDHNIETEEILFATFEEYFEESIRIRILLKDIHRYNPDYTSIIEKYINNSDYNVK